MGQRLDLHKLLVDILGESSRVYFQPPPSLIMRYPCIVYERDNRRTLFADNGSYLDKIRYQVVVIDRDPDSDLPNKIAQLPFSSFDRTYVQDGLHHDSYNVYF